MPDACAILQELGFSEYEARAYVALVKRNPLNGYELAKASGVPRPNIYAVLQKLEERNIVVREDEPDGVRYSPVPPAELIGRLGSRFNNILEAANQSLEAIAAPAERDYVWNIQGYDAVIEHAQSLVCAANRELLLAVWQPESQALSEAVTSATDRKVAVSTLCLQECPQDCADCRGSLYRYRVVTNRRSRWMMVVRDGEEVLLGDIRSGDVSAVRSKQAHLIEMASWYIRHSIALAALLGDLDGKVQHVLKPETRALLHALGPGEAGWLDYMLELSRK